MAVLFAADIAPLFTERDIGCMSGFGVELDDYGYMGDATGDATFSDHANARHVHARLAGTERPRMPAGGPFWSEAQLQLFDQWMTDGFLA